MPCGTASSICCSSMGRVLANNGTAYDGYSIAFNNAAFTLFSMNATVRVCARAAVSALLMITSIR